MRGAAPTNSTPSVVPMISYEDGIAPLEWLRNAFGFRETARLTTADGKLSHGEMKAGDGMIMLASPTPDYRGPKHHREVCEQGRKWSDEPGLSTVSSRLRRQSRSSLQASKSRWRGDPV